MIEGSLKRFFKTVWQQPEREVINTYQVGFISIAEAAAITTAIHPIVLLVKVQ